MYVCTYSCIYTQIQVSYSADGYEKFAHGLAVRDSFEWQHMVSSLWVEILAADEIVFVMHWKYTCARYEAFFAFFLVFQGSFSLMLEFLSQNLVFFFFLLVIQRSFKWVSGLFAQKLALVFNGFLGTF